MDNQRKSDLLESFRIQMGIERKEEKATRTEYVASSNTLKINNSFKENVETDTKPKEETMDDQIKRLAELYKSGNSFRK